MGLEEIKKFSDSRVLAVPYNLTKPEEVVSVPSQVLKDAYQVAHKALAVYVAGLLKEATKDLG